MEPTTWMAVASVAGTAFSLYQGLSSAMSVAAPMMQMMSQLQMANMQMQAAQTQALAFQMEGQAQMQAGIMEAQQLQLQMQTVAMQAEQEELQRLKTLDLTQSANLASVRYDPFSSPSFLALKKANEEEAADEIKNVLFTRKSQELTLSMQMGQAGLSAQAGQMIGDVKAAAAKNAGYIDATKSRIGAVTSGLTAVSNVGNVISSVGNMASTFGRGGVISGGSSSNTLGSAYTDTL